MLTGRNGIPTALSPFILKLFTSGACVANDWSSFSMRRTPFLFVIVHRPNSKEANMADFIRCPRCNRLFTVEDGGELPAHYAPGFKYLECEEPKQGDVPALPYPSHIFSDILDPGGTPRCLGCDVRPYSKHAIPPCPDSSPFAETDNQPYGERNVIGTSQIEDEPLDDARRERFNIPTTVCKHPGIERAEGNYFWCIACRLYVANV
jgi:hypothetical protein